MTVKTTRHRSTHLQLNGFEATIWECYNDYDCDRPDELEYLFSIQRLNTDEVMKAFSYGLDETQTVLRLTRWAEAQIASCYEDLP